MVDIVFCSIPYSNLDHIYSAPAILRGVVEQQGYTARTVDFGCMLLNLCDRDIDKFTKVQSYFISPTEVSTDVRYIIDNFYKQVIEYFKQNPSRYIGLSVFSIYTHKATMEICQLIKDENLSSQVIVGGRGLFIGTYPSIRPIFNLSPIERVQKFSDVLKNRHLVDHTVIGDGEDAILKILKDNYIVNDTKSDMFKYPIPNYSDYNFNDYLFDNQSVMLPITGSKGCVRDCDFCDVAAQFGRYRYRNGVDIANEMISIVKKYGIKKFQFTDSLVNGGMKPFEEFLINISQWNNSNPDQAVTWSGQYICRPASEIPARLRESYYTLLKDSGAEGLTIGAESGSNAVLAAINKKTTVEALYQELEQLRKHNITCMLLTFPGHWSETWENFKEHCDMLINITPYVRFGTVSALNLGPPMIIIDGTPARENCEKNQIILSNFDPGNIWYVKNNPDNTYKERLYRRLLADRLTKALNIPTIADYETYLVATNLVDYYSDQINEFYEQFF